MLEYDEGEHVKETFACFGRAFYMSNVFEAGLASAILQVEFLNNERMRRLAEDGNNFDRVRYEADFEAFIKHQRAQTMGNLIKRAEKVLSFDEDIQKIIKEAKRRRDFLAHHYFRARTIEFSSRKGKDLMIEELNEANNIFILADRLLDKMLEPHRNRLGFTKKLLDDEIETMMQEASELDKD